MTRPLHWSRLLILVLLLLALPSLIALLGATPQARAHDDMHWIEARWPTSGLTVTDVTYREAPSVSGLSSTMQSAITFGESPWNQLGTSLRLVGGADLSSEPDPRDCASGVNSLHYGPIDGRADPNAGTGLILAQTWQCYAGPWPNFGEPGQMLHFAIVYDSAENWHPGTGAPGSGQTDLRGVSVHEFGHAAGWTRHFSTAQGQCSNTPLHTMCPSVPPETTDWRSLELHDRHTYTAAY